MHRIFLLLLLHLPQSVLGENPIQYNFMKPDFSPYCITKDTCWLDCECNIAKNCQIVPMTEQMKQEILNLLNNKRDKQTSENPTPSGISMLIYDNHLEQLSKCWTANCINHHSECFRTDRFAETSQTVGQIKLNQVKDFTTAYWSQIIEQWYNELNSLKTEIIVNVPMENFSEKFHNFAQMLSDKVLYVGCSWSLLVSTITFVCTFGPRGAQEGEGIYKVGKNCTTCPESYRCVPEKPFENLCKKLMVEKTLVNLTTGVKPRSQGDHNNGTKLPREVDEDTDEQDEKKWDILWWFGIALVLLLMVVILILSLFYIFKLDELSCC